MLTRIDRTRKNANINQKSFFYLFIITTFFVVDKKLARFFLFLHSLASVSAVFCFFEFSSLAASIWTNANKQTKVSVKKKAVCKMNCSRNEMAVAVVCTYVSVAVVCANVSKEVDRAVTNKIAAQRREAATRYRRWGRHGRRNCSGGGSFPLDLGCERNDGCVGRAGSGG